MNPGDAADKGLADGERVVAWNDLGEAVFILRVTEKVPAGVVVAEGVWWLEFAPGDRSVNVLTSQRLTDQGGGSTFYDNRVDVRTNRNMNCGKSRGSVQVRPTHPSYTTRRSFRYTSIPCVLIRSSRLHRCETVFPHSWCHRLEPA